MEQNTQIQCKIKSNGFTLIEMAMSLMIIGIMLSSGLYAYSVYLTNLASTRTLEAVSTVTTAIYEYKNAHGRYPCPSPILESKDTSPNYGHETNCADPNIGTGAVVPPGTCLDGTVGPNNYNGICVEASTRTILGVNPRVRVGGIPFRELQIDEKDTFDGYGSRLVYAVTEDMAVSASFKETIAGIELRDGAGNILSGADRSVSFLVFSPGKNKNGAVNMNGTAQQCLTTATDLDAENCRDFASNTNTQSIYVMNAQASGTNSFDDIVEYFVPTNAEVWRRESNVSENIVDMSEDKVGVGITSPMELTDSLTVKQSTINNAAILTGPNAGKPDFSQSGALAATNTLGGVYQNGALRVGRWNGTTQSGKILSDVYCAEDGTNCFSTDVIAGTYDNDPTTGTSGMGCPTGQYMIGIEAGRAKCAPIRIWCPAGQVIYGTDGNGGPLCTTPMASCVSENKTLCGTSYLIPAAGNGVPRVIWYTTGGACAKAQYTCTSGTWTYNAGSSYDSTFACSFVSATPPTGSTPGVSCGGGYSGTYTQNYKKDCNGNDVNTTNTSAADCTCVGVTDNVTCDANFGSAVVGTKKRVCTANVLDASYTVFTGTNGVSYGSEALLRTALCTCGKSDFWEFASCGTGKIRKASPTPSSFTAPVQGWDGDTNKGGYRKRTVNTTACTYDNVGYDYTNCECTTGYNKRYVNPTCPSSCYKVDTQGEIRQIRSGTSCDWTDDPDTSANTVGTCTPKTFIWKNSGVSAGPANSLAEGHGVSPLCDSTCACGESGSQSACALSTASQWTYFSSTCTVQ